MSKNNLLTISGHIREYLSVAEILIVSLGPRPGPEACLADGRLAACLDAFESVGLTFEALVYVD